ncbi:hypothetical protein BST97_13925 [Nonlabens spongiae]|uniref:Uncharacterized protein n=1 Tax=Nonlabens spongiae TaxID=331648 RepID=A0A1W6MN29_9FLAO|nr:gliding motility-associated C-terminal domain-containing protein [Nonlabens spongiae]ARN78998.1 hypothetical protein BST97_13925 [Nonlabens spongiae]
MKHQLTALLLICLSFIARAQTTDLAITLEARNLTGNAISQAHIYERYTYLLTISNTGAPVSDATFSFNLSSVEEIESAVAQNILGGATSPSNIDINQSAVSGTLLNMPNSSSVEILITVRAEPTFLGGATAMATVQPPPGTTDVNPATNDSVISIIMTERDIIFDITQSQIAPAGGAGISNWGDTVSYEMTITNNSSIEYPLEDFELFVSNVNRAGSAIYTFIDLQCSSSSGMSCPTLDGLSTVTTTDVIGNFRYYIHGEPVVFPSGASFTMQVSYTLDEGGCDRDARNIPLIMGNRLTIIPFLNNTNFIQTDTIETATLINDPCQCVDLETEVIRTSPTASSINAWTDVVTYEFTYSNNGPIEVPAFVYMVNGSTVGTEIEILTAECISTSGPVDCNDFNITITPDTRWVTSQFQFPPNSSITIRVTVVFSPPECTQGGALPNLAVRGVATEFDNDVLECDSTNNSVADRIDGLPVNPCNNDPGDGELIELEEVQVSPVPGAGPYPYGEVSYEIIMRNTDSIAHQIRFKDLQSSDGTGILRSIDCIGTTGGASCPSSLNARIDQPNQNGDTFWEILDADGFMMPANSSLTFEKVIDWRPPCQDTVFSVADNLVMEAVDSNLDVIDTVTASVATPMVPCVDIVVQTFPSITSAPINTDFEWVVDITNSNVSVDASDLTFNNLMHPDFEITGTPICSVVNGTASCMPTFNINGNAIEAVIPSMSSGSTIQVRIPTRTPSYGGSFENRAEVQPDFEVTGETTPSSNISTSSLFILTTQTSKEFEPSVINSGEVSTLTFNLRNSVGLPAQSGINFTDNLPAGMTISGEAFWVNQNGALGTFTGVVGGDAFGIQDLSFPSGTDEVSFAVEVTCTDPGIYINDFQNFSNLNNLDVSTVFASLEVLPVLDLAITKTVDILDPEVNDTVTFTIEVQNLQTAGATGVTVQENLPSGYTYVSHSTDVGIYDSLSGVWQVGDLAAGATTSMQITVSLNIPGEFINVVTVDSISTFTDIDLENNTAEAFARPDCIVVPEGFTPNGDGRNDTFEIRCINLYPESELVIVNRYGSTVYKATNYQNDWDGTPTQGLLHDSDKALPTGTYYWKLDLKDGSQARVGWLYINY